MLSSKYKICNLEIKFKATTYSQQDSIPTVLKMQDSSCRALDS